VRITRSLNNIHMEQAEKKMADVQQDTEELNKKVTECVALFNTVLGHMERLKPGVLRGLKQAGAAQPQITLNTAQSYALEKIALELKAMLVDLNKQAEEA
jgi:hypothetical protein